MREDSNTDPTLIRKITGGDNMKMADVSLSDRTASKLPALGTIVVQALLLDLAIARHDCGDGAPAVLMREQRARIARVSKISNIHMKNGGADEQVLMQLVRAMQAPEQSDGDAVADALAGLEDWYRHFLLSIDFTSL